MELASEHRVNPPSPVPPVCGPFSGPPRCRHRLRRYLEEAMDAAVRGTTLLQSRTIKDSVRRECERELGLLKE